MTGAVRSRGLLRSSLARFLSASLPVELDLQLALQLAGVAAFVRHDEGGGDALAPARPVRPMRWTKSSEPLGRS